MNSKGADQPAHLHSLISTFVVHFLKRIISKLVSYKLLMFQLVSIAEQTGLSLTLSEIPQNRFSNVSRSILYLYLATTDTCQLPLIQKITNKDTILYIFIYKYTNVHLFRSKIVHIPKFKCVLMSQLG